jgi:hypothetical protein
MTRDEDEKLLGALAMYVRGDTLHQIARLTGMNTSTIGSRMARIRTEDAQAEKSAEKYWQAVMDRRARLT